MIENRFARFTFILSISLVGTVTHWLSYTQTDFANGWDSYFYLVQIKSLIETGSMHSEEWSLIYPLVLGFKLLVGDSIFAMKVTMIFLVLSFAWSCYWLIYSIQKKHLIALVSLSLAIFSPELTYFAAQWPKNLLGVILLINLIAALQNRSKVLIICLVVAGFFGHRMTAILNILVIVGWLGHNRLTIKFFITVSIALVLGILLIQLIPGLLNIHDVDRLRGFLGNNFQIAPSKLVDTLGHEKIDLWWKAELFILSIAFLFTLLKVGLNIMVDIRKPALFLFVLLVVILWFPFYQITLAGAPYRFYHVGALFLPVLAPQIMTSNRVNWIFIIGFTALSFFSFKSYNPVTHDPPYSKYNKVSQKLKSTLVNKPDLLIAHKGLADYLDYEMSIDAMAWVPKYEIPEERLLRVAYLPFPKLFEYYTGKPASELSTFYYLVQENDWQVFLKELKLNEEEDLYLEHIDWRNPGTTRPKYLLKSK